MLSDSSAMSLMNPAIPGLVWAYHFHPGAAPCTRLPLDAARSDLDVGDGFLWLHLNLVDSRVNAFLENFPGLTPPAIAALTTHDTHAAVTLDEQLVYGTLVDFQREFDSDTRDIGWLHFFVSDRVIITTRLQPLRSIDRVRTAIEKNASATRSRSTCSRRWSPNSSEH